MIVVWRVTQQCNLACPFCAWDRRLPLPRPRIAAERVRRFGRLLADHQRQTGEPILLSWLGGEPLLWPALRDLAPQIRELGIAQSTTTNGTTLAAPTSRALILANFSELTVSIDGFADFHDTMRGQPGLWQQTRQGIARLAEARASRAAPKLRANIVLMRDNQEVFALLCRELADWGIDEITFNALGGRDRPEFFPAHRLRPQDSQRLDATLPALREELAERGVRLCGGSDYLARIGASARQEAMPVDNCAPGERFLFIDESGRISPCNFTTDDYALRIEDIDSSATIARLPALFAERRRQAPAAVCEDCPSTQVFAKFAV